ncbi:hypothetical protein LAZ67_6003458 [Cordylochernes scorpioides]|uniref:Integrase catalytic domain-containing protein n=1 Tax=Cordylochernes scorpioides TaxID=51811 RepID=A0ABY6KKL3_9ARAC|nr:hypothetical protein LAZ67_6003458 [Cordylochernes scorpioides]
MELQETGRSVGLCHQIVTKDLDMIRTSSKFVPQILTEEQREVRMDICKNMVEMTRTDPEWIQKIITGEPARQARKALSSLRGEPRKIAQDLALLNKTYEEVKESLCAVYPRRPSFTLQEFYELKCTSMAEIETYYKNKVRIGLAINLPKSAIVQALSNGVPRNYGNLLKMAQPSGPEEWLCLAQQLTYEVDNTSTKAAQQRSPRQSRAPSTTVDKTPPYPCRYCGGQHWHAQCQQRGPYQRTFRTFTPAVHNVEQPQRSTGPAGVYETAATTSSGETNIRLRALRSYERNYTISELECLAIVECVDKFRVYLLGTRFVIYSDHHALQWLKTIKDPTGRLFCWSLRLSAYDYEVKYLKGSRQYEADLLSRNPFCGFLSTGQIKDHQGELRRDTRPGEESFEIFVQRFEAAFEANALEEGKRMPIFVSLLDSEMLKLGNDLFFPSTMKEQPYERLIQRIKLHLAPRKKVIPQQCRFLKRIQLENESVSEYLRALRHLAMDYTFGEMLEVMLRDRFVAGIKSESLQKKLLQEDDDVTLDRVFSIAVSFELAEQNAKELQDGLVSKMDIVPGGNRKNEARRGWQHGPDAYTKWLEIVIIKDITSRTIIGHLREIFARFGLPELLVTDNGRQFVSSEFEEFTKINGIRHTKTSPYNPSTNGLAERYSFSSNGIKGVSRGTFNEKKSKIKIFKFDSENGEEDEGRYVKRHINQLRPVIKKEVPEVRDLVLPGTSRDFILPGTSRDHPRLGGQEKTREEAPEVDEELKGAESSAQETLQNQNRALLLRLSLSLCRVQDRSDPEDRQNQNRALLLRLSLSLCAVQDRSDPEDRQTGCTTIKRGDVLCM